MRITFLGQAGLLFESEQCVVCIDPYFSDSVKKSNPKNYRRVPVDRRVFDLKPNVFVFTHNHLDHYDPETVERMLTPTSGAVVLSPKSVWDEVRKIGGNNNYVLFDRGTVWSMGDITFTAVRAQHSDPYAIGIILDDGEKKYYVTGDTLYHKDVVEEIPQGIYAVFLPINGVGNNMNATDAKKFAESIAAEKVVPLHFGMFDSISPESLTCDNRVIPYIYQEVRL